MQEGAGPRRADEIDASVPGHEGEQAGEERGIEHRRYSQQVGNETVARNIFPCRKRCIAERGHIGNGE